MSDTIIIKNTTDELTWNWRPEFHGFPLCRVVVSWCVEIEDGDDGFFLTCPTGTSEIETAANVKGLTGTGDKAVPILLRLEDEADGRKLVVYFVSMDDMNQFLNARAVELLTLQIAGFNPIRMAS